MAELSESHVLSDSKACRRQLLPFALILKNPASLKEVSRAASSVRDEVPIRIELSLQCMPVCNAHTGGVISHVPDTHSAAEEQAAPSALQAAVHESTEPVAPVNISVVVAAPVSQQRVLLMLLSLNIRLKVVTFETSQQEISWSKEDSLNILLMRVTDEVSHAEIS